ncbi:MAG: transposase, partial [Rickettsia endosymbiont of Bryobia graminum]|nr:transposase [Rickettsia endosymbiont of Bryobia graminum]
MSKYIHKSHNFTVLLYHMAFPAKYRRALFPVSVDQLLPEPCLEIDKSYQIKLLEIWADEDHVHFLAQSLPTYSETKLLTTIQTLPARHLARPAPQA